VIGAVLWALALGCSGVSVRVPDGNFMGMERICGAVFSESISSPAHLAEQEPFACLAYKARIQCRAIGNTHQRNGCQIGLPTLDREQRTSYVDFRSKRHFFVGDQHRPVFNSFRHFLQMFIEKFGPNLTSKPQGVEAMSSHADPFRRRLANVFESDSHPEPKFVARERSFVADPQRQSDPRAPFQFRDALSDFIGAFGFSESRPDKKHPDSTETHAYHSGGAHYVGPQSGLFLGYKVLFVALMCAAFVACLGNAVRLIDRGLADAGIPYLFIGIFGILTSLIIGLPLVFGGP